MTILIRGLGGANGIGKAIVELLHTLGSTVAFCDLNASAGQALERQIGS
jgi:NAD(P)-dependent dehydrogenase (short-subunit alcohol dehydrogenase family)